MASQARLVCRCDARGCPDPQPRCCPAARFAQLENRVGQRTRPQRQGPDHAPGALREPWTEKGRWAPAPVPGKGKWRGFHAVSGQERRWGLIIEAQRQILLAREARGPLSDLGVWRRLAANIQDYAHSTASCVIAITAIAD
jgi:hypothetical protein